MNKYTYYVAYEDKGPSGPCGQITSVTAPWRKLYIFDDEIKAREFVDSTHTCRRRLPKIVGFWSDDPNYNNVVEDK